jgi:hypothetical protein
VRACVRACVFVGMIRLELGEIKVMKKAVAFFMRALQRNLRGRLEYVAWSISTRTLLARSRININQNPIILHNLPRISWLVYNLPGTWIKRRT